MRARIITVVTRTVFNFLKRVLQSYLFHAFKQGKTFWISYPSGFRIPNMGSYTVCYINTSCY
jgi:hypothetical protein